MKLFQMPIKIIYENEKLTVLNKIFARMQQIISEFIEKYKKFRLKFDILIFVNKKYHKDLENYYLSKINEKINIISTKGAKNTQNFNIFLIETIQDLEKISLKNVLL